MLSKSTLLLLLLLHLHVAPTAAFFSIFFKLLFRPPKRPNSHGLSVSFETLRDTCGRTPACASYPEGAETNCVLRCMSRSCWGKVYEGELLEPGQVDHPARTKRFHHCLLRLEGTLRGVGLWPPTISEETGCLVEPGDEKVEDFGDNNSPGPSSSQEL